MDQQVVKQPNHFNFKQILAMLISFCIGCASACGQNVHISMPDSRTVQAYERNNKAVVHYSTPSARADGYSGHINVDRIRGPSSGSWFGEGTTEVKYKFHANGESEERSFYVTVQVPRCSASEVRLPFANGNRYCQTDCGELNVNGVACQHTCNTGFDLMGSPIVTCAGTRWSSSFPYCKPNTCFEPSQSIRHGLWICAHGFGIDEQCHLQCESGFTQQGTTLKTCLASGLWEQLWALCNDTENPKFPVGCVLPQNVYSQPRGQPENVTWSDPATQDNSGDPVTMTYSLGPGSAFALGQHVVTVTATDLTGNSAQCSFNVTVRSRLCQPLPSVEHSSGLTCSHEWMEGSACSYSCIAGYEIQGHGTLTCQRSEVWNNAPPQCIRVSCGQPTPVQRGHFLCPDGTRFTDVCRLICNPGYAVVGQRDVTCQADRRWSSVGYCHDVEPPLFVSGCDDFEVYAAPLGQATVVRWPHPEVMDNSMYPVTLKSDVDRVMYRPGVTKVTLTAFDPTGNNSTCSFMVTIVTLRCGEPKLELNDSMIYHPSPYGDVYGVTWSVSCPSNYTRLGSDVITCDVDNTTYPPVPRWTWPGESNSMKPTCAKISCPPLRSPENGALSCFQGERGVDCYLSCDDRHELPRLYNSHAGLFSCSSQLKLWIPPSMPDCVVPVPPDHVRANTEIHYYADSCQHSLQELQRDFIHRISSSLVYRDACVGVPLCVRENVQVSCGLIKENRRRRRRTTREARVTVTVQLKIKSHQGNDTRLQGYRSIHKDVLDRLENALKTGELDLPGMALDHDVRVVEGKLHCECLPGTVCTLNQRSDRIYCVGCGKGHFLPEGSDVCEECPVGSYQEEEIAVNCTPCPPGMSTVTTATVNGTQCVGTVREGELDRGGLE